MEWSVLRAVALALKNVYVTVLSLTNFIMPNHFATCLGIDFLIFPIMTVFSFVMICRWIGWDWFNFPDRED